MDARAAAILAEGVEAHTFVPIAAWPESAPDMARLSGVIEKALSEKRGVAQPDTAEGARYTHIAYPVLIGDRIGAVVALEMGGNEIQARAALRQIHWGSAWLSHMFAMREIDLAVAGRDRVAGVLDTVAVALRHGKFHHALFEVTNELRQRFGCSRVAFGLVEHAAVKLTALSEAATFERNTPIVKAYTAAMNETYDHGAPINASTVIRGKAAQAVNGAAPLDMADLAPPHPAHLVLMVCSGDTDVLSYPMMQGAHCIAVITLEKSADVGFEAGDMAWLEAFTTLLAPIMAQRKAAERSALTRLISRLESADLRLTERIGTTLKATKARELTGGVEELPSAALGIAGGGAIPTAPNDPNGVKTIGRVFLVDLRLAPDTLPSAFGERVHVRFNHGFEPPAIQGLRRLRQLFLSRFGV